MKIIFKFLILSLMFFSAVYSKEKYNYEILGNQRISDQTIISIIDFKKNRKYDVEDLIITDMWANVLKHNEHHPVHTHSNNFLSGTYYLQSDQGASIVFHDPRPAADVIVPRKKEKNTYNSSLLSYASRTNRAIFFPAWLPHWVQQNKSNNKRISIAWNMQVKGQVGEHHEFQSANF